MNLAETKELLVSDAKQVIKVLFSFLQNSNSDYELYNALLIQSRSFDNLNEQILQATLSYNEIIVQNNKIMSAILQIIDALGEKYGFGKDLEAFNQEGSFTEIGTKIDWGTSPGLEVFYGRKREQEQLENSIMEGSRLISVIGLKGVGKTKTVLKTLKGKDDPISGHAIKPKIEEKFQFVVWRSLLNAPTLRETLTDLYFFFTKNKYSLTNSTLNDLFRGIIQHLKENRCLVVLDNLESVLSPGSNTLGEVKEYLNGYEDYGEFLKLVGTTSHQSCFIITSRENPKAVYTLVTKNGPVKSFDLKGVSVKECKEIFNGISTFYASEKEWQRINSFYQGNPLALELAARHIDSAFFGDVSSFLKGGKTIFSDLYDLIHWHFKRLTEDEKTVLIWLAINREPMTLKEIKNELFSESLKQKIPSNLQSLQRKIPVERNFDQFSLQPVLVEFLTEFIINSANNEINVEESTLNAIKEKVLIQAAVKNISEGTVGFINRFCLMKAVSKEYVRHSQLRLIIRPIINRLIAKYGNKEIVKMVLVSILESSSLSADVKPGYLAGNILNLLANLLGQLNALKLDDLFIRQAHFQGLRVTDCSFQRSDIEKTSFTSTFGGIMGADINRQENRMIIGDISGVISCYSIPEEELLFSIKAHDSSIESIFYVNEDTMFISGSTDKKIKLWDAASLECITVFNEHKDWVREIAVNSKLNILGSASEDKSVIFWDLNSGKLLASLNHHKSWVDTIDISKDQSLAASSGNDGVIYIYDLTSFKIQASLKTPLGKWIRELKFLQGTTLLAAGGDDGLIHIWDINSNEYLFDLSDANVRDGILTISYDPHRKSIASSGESGDVRIWNLQERECIAILQGHTKRVRTLKYSQSGKILLSAGEDKSIRLWDMDTKRCLMLLDGYTNQIMSARISNLNDTILSGSEDGIARVWSLDGKCLKEFIGHDERVFDVSLSEKNRKLITVSQDKSVKVWDFDNQNLLKSIHLHNDWVRKCTISPDEKLFASCSEDQTVFIWDMLSLEVVWKLFGHTGRIWSVCFSEDGQKVMTASDDATIIIWDVNTGEQSQILKGHEERVWSACFCMNDQAVISVSDDTTIRLWDLKDGGRAQVLSGHKKGIRALAICKEKNLFATGGDDNVILIWDLEKQNVLKKIVGHEERIWDLSFDSKGMILVSCSEDEQIKIWDVGSGANLKTIFNPRPYEKSSFENVQSLSKSQLLSLQRLGATI